MYISDIRGKLENLKECKIIGLACMIMLGFFLVGVLGMITPYVYAVLPVYENSVCMCTFV